MKGKPTDQPLHVLLVLDHLESDWAGMLQEKDNTGVEYNLLTLGFSSEQAYMRYGASARYLKEKVPAVDTSTIYSAAEEQARASYLNLIKEFPEKKEGSRASLFDLLSYKGRNLWWYLPLTEKTIWLGKMIHRLYAFFCLFQSLENKRYDEVHLYIKDETVSRVLKELAENKGLTCINKQKSRRCFRFSLGSAAFLGLYFFQVFKELFKVFIKITTLKLTGIKSNIKLDPGSIGFFSIYPFWWRDPFSEKATDLIFNTLPDELAEKTRVKHIIWLMPGLALFKKKEGFSNFSRHHDVLLLEELIDLRDVLALGDLRMFLKLFRVYRSAPFNKTILFGADITQFIIEDFFQSLTAPMFFQCLLIDRAMQKLSLEQLHLLLYRIEFQPLERAVLYNAYQKTTTIGFQHSALGKNFLNYVFPESELEIHWHHRNDINCMPLPDFILTTGEQGVQYFRRAGYPTARLAVGGAVRYGPLFQYARAIPGVNDLRKRYGLSVEKTILFVGTSPLIQETVCLLNDLLTALQPRSNEYHVILKFHPGAFVVPGFIKTIDDVLKKYLDSVSLGFSEPSISLYDYLSLSNAILLTGGTLALEAMVLGCIPIIYINDAQFSHNPMTDYRKAVIAVRDLFSMQKALETIGDTEATKNLKRNWSEPLSEIFGDFSVDPNKRFIETLQENFNIL